MPDNFPASTDVNSPAHNAAAVTPHDTNELPTWARSLYIGAAGHVKVTTAGGDEVTFSNVPVGVLPVRAKIVHATGTTAGSIVAMY